MKTRVHSVIFVIFLLFYLCNVAKAQEKPLKFGLMAGPQLTLTNIDIAGVDIDTRFASAFGGVVEYWVSPSIAFQGNILYNLKGALFTEEVSGGSIEVKWGFDYLSVPVLAKFAFGDLF